MKGKWTGEYWYTGNIPNELKNQKVGFELTIEDFSNSKISGSIFDNIEMGGTEGVGSISGTVEGDKVQFIKRMPKKTVVLSGGKRIIEDKPHRPIYYKGRIDKETGIIQGTWRFKIGMGIIKGRIAFFPGTKGEWKMKLEA